MTSDSTSEMIHLTVSGIISDAALPLREEHRAATRRRILQAGIERLAEDHPAGISMPAVARQAGISVATLYRYFPSKEKLLDGAAQFRHEIVGHAPLDVFAPEPYLRVVFRELVEYRPLVLAQHSSPRPAGPAAASGGQASRGDEAAQAARGSCRAGGPGSPAAAGPPGHADVVAVADRLRQPGELRPGDRIALAEAKAGRTCGDGRLPSGRGIAAGGIGGIQEKRVGLRAEKQLG